MVQAFQFESRTEGEEQAFARATDSPPSVKHLMTCQAVDGAVLTIPPLVGSVLILQMRKLRLVEVEGFVPGHLKAKMQDWWLFTLENDLADPPNVKHRVTK